MDGPPLDATVAQAAVFFVRRKVKFSKFMKVQPYYFGECHHIVFETSRCAPKNEKLLSESTKKTNKFTRNQTKNKKILSKPTRKPKNSFEINQKTQKFNRNQPKKLKILSKLNKKPKIISKSTKKVKNSLAIQTNQKFLLIQQKEFQKKFIEINQKNRKKNLEINQKLCTTV